jgi:molybdenum cofactor cytidylyltransferase
MSPIALILLAAGSSTRMGQPKQLLLYKGQTLLRRAAQQALTAGCNPVIVVIGSSAPAMRTELKDLPVQIIENPNWQNGMGTSIRAGLTALSPLIPSPSTRGEGKGEGSPPSAVIITLCDQPLIDSAALTQLINLHHTTNRPLIAAQYANTLGVPALFAPQFLPALASLPDEAGAKQILLKHAADVLPLPMELAATDIDMPLDYQQLK